MPELKPYAARLARQFHCTTKRVYSVFGECLCWQLQCQVWEFGSEQAILGLECLRWFSLSPALFTTQLPKGYPTLLTSPSCALHHCQPYQAIPVEGPHSQSQGWKLQTNCCNCPGSHQKLRQYLIPSVLSNSPVCPMVQTTLPTSFQYKLKDSAATFRTELRDKGLKCGPYPLTSF